MRYENKVLIALSLKTDESIIEFVKWLKSNYPTDEYIEIDQDIIAGHASLIAKERGIEI
jgi:hypothetical protein